MIDVFTEILIFATKNSLGGVTYTIDDIVKEGIIPDSRTDIGKLEVNKDLKLIKLEGQVGLIDFPKSINKFLSLLPITDLDKRCKKDEDSIIKKYFPKVLENELFLKNREQAHKLEKLSETEMLKFIATEGIGAHLLKEEITIDKDGVEHINYVIDLLFLSKFEVRSKLIPYGAKLVLDRKFKVLHITTNCVVFNKKIFKRSHDYDLDSLGWRFAYNLFMSSLLMHETVCNHAIECHFKVAGNVLASYYKNKKDMNKDVYNTFLIFLYRTQEVNDRAYEILVNEGGLVSRIFALSSKGLKEYFQYVCDNWKFTPPYQEDIVDTPLKSDLIEYWKVFQSFSEKLVDRIKSDIYQDPIWLIDFNKEILKYSEGIVDPKENMISNLKRVLTAVIYNATVYHEYIGNVSRYLIYPKITSCKLFKSKPSLVNDTEQNYIQAIFLAAITSVQKMPKIIDDLWKVQTEKTQDIWKELQEILNSKDFRSKLKTEYLLPEFLECSVSL